MFHVVVVLVFPCTCSWAESIKFVENHWHLHHHMMLRFLTFTCLFNLISDRRMVHAQECKLSFKNGMSRNTGNYKTHHQGMCKSKMKVLLNLAIWRVGKTPHVDSRFERVRNLSTQSISHSGCMHSLQMNDLNASGEFSKSKL